MAFKYEPNKWQGSVNNDRCPAAVHEQGRGVGFHQCSRNRGKHPEGWCSTHDPENEKKRKERSYQLYKQKLEDDDRRRIEWALATATVEQLEAELKRRKK